MPLARSTPCTIQAGTRPLCRREIIEEIRNGQKVDNVVDSVSCETLMIMMTVRLTD